MISPDEIHKKAERIYHTQFLPARLAGLSIFPLTLPCAKGKSTDPIPLRMEELSRLMGREKTRIGHGYQVRFKEVETRKSGSQSVPDVLFFETETDFLKFIGKTGEVADFDRDLSLILTQLPRLAPWVKDNPLQIIRHAGKWSDILKVCRYFIETPRPDLYIRELPIDVHTKFIEENKGIVTALLDALLPPTAIFPEEKRFERRFGLRYDQPLIRFRLLDTALCDQLVPGLTDFSLPITDLAATEIRCDHIFIVENKMNFLTFPRVKKSLVIWGRGFAVEQLREIPWLHGKSIFYWGDIDPHGFEILSLLRQYFPESSSIMMDGITFDRFSRFAAQGSPSRSEVARNLTKDERALLQRLIDRPDCNRLEQEKIPQHHVLGILYEMGFTPPVV